MLDGKKILITGGTGSLGTALTKRLLKTGVETIRIYSRDEWKQVQMQSSLNDKRLRFLIGDVRDKERLLRATEDIDILIHAAALKQVPVAEYNPFEAVQTNVHGAQNVIEACFRNEVENALAVGTDKAVSPFNTYGATKFLMERLFISANYYKGKHKTNFFGVRYGNVLGSRGSIVHVMANQIKNKQKITITDPTMTRFNITMPQALDLIFRALENGTGGELFIPKLKAYRLEDMKNAIFEILDSQNEVEFIGARPGEKYHETLISKDETRNTYETNMDYIIYEKETQDLNKKINAVKSNISEQYSSDKVELFTKDELKDILLAENLLPAQ